MLNAVPITNSGDEVQTDEETVHGIIELPLQLEYHTEQDKPPDPTASEDNNAETPRPPPSAMSPTDAAVPSITIIVD